jgi:Fe2+ or Zn2+ uptake regulation protein
MPDTTPTPENIRLALRNLSESGYEWTHEVLARATAPMTKRALTAKQHKVYDYLAKYIHHHQYAPSYNEIAREMGFASLATVWEHLMQLERRGWIVREAKRERGIRLTP